MMPVRRQIFVALVVWLRASDGAVDEEPSEWNRSTWKPRSSATWSLRPSRGPDCRRAPKATQEWGRIDGRF